MAGRILSYGSTIDAVANQDQANAVLQANRAAQSFNQLQSGAAALERGRTRENAQRNWDLSYMLQKENLKLNERRVKATEELNTAIKQGELDRKKLEDKHRNAFRIVRGLETQLGKGMLDPDNAYKIAESFKDDPDLDEYYTRALTLGDESGRLQDEDYEMAAGAADQANALLAPTKQEAIKAATRSKEEQPTGWFSKAVGGIQDFAPITGLGPETAKKKAEAAQMDVVGAVPGIVKGLGDLAPFVRFNQEKQLFEPSVMPSKKTREAMERRRAAAGGGAGTDTPAPAAGAPVPAAAAPTTPLAPVAAGGRSVTTAGQQIVMVEDLDSGQVFPVDKVELNRRVDILMGQGHDKETASRLAIRSIVERNSNEHTRGRSGVSQRDEAPISPIRRGSL